MLWKHLNTLPKQCPKSAPPSNPELNLLHKPAQPKASYLAHTNPQHMPWYGRPWSLQVPDLTVDGCLLWVAHKDIHVSKYSASKINNNELDTLSPFQL
jgi:hypothetical protein